ncbi:hypothetical protein [Microbacterium sp. IEGM 1404]|uniref:hypothetical protein n=1 Tax=Microbacterium sp. IEGM 1404 TaxID=3047084 RepID=UPI0024B75673|nr:hypothetical protein [Microbacterium sp. IEGM 1404]MDI9892867.1 hypothetical protein [Microbacterium sp. IEGM 1404]
MSRETRQIVDPESPVSFDWTLAELLDWIAIADARCHDERLLGALDAIDRALAPTTAPTPPAVVLVRALASRVAADPSLGRRRLGDVIGQPAPALAESARALVAV